MWLWEIFGLTLMDAHLVSKRFAWFVKLCRAMHLPKGSADFSFHFFSYAALAFLLAGAIRGGYFTRINIKIFLFTFLSCAVLGVLQECLQYFSPTRHPSLFDVGTNIVGVSFGLAIMIAYNFAKSAIRKTGSNVA
jgi:VanZ family protein